MAIASEATVVGATASTIYQSIKAGGTDPNGVIAISIHNYGTQPIRVRLADWNAAEWARIAAGKSATMTVHPDNANKQIDAVIVQRATDATGDSTISFLPATVR